MKHFVAYDNSERRGFSCEDIPDDEPLTVVTDKPVGQLPGSRVWLIEGRGRPTVYFLCATFVVDRIGSDESGEYLNSASSDGGDRFSPLIPLSRDGRFGDLVREQNNFQFGLREIKNDAHVAELRVLAQGDEADLVPGEGGAQGFDSSETNRRVEEAALSHVRSLYENDGWSVVSVERENRGYNLVCTRARDEEHVEVKGVQDAVPSFIITAREVRQAQTDSALILCVVTSALTSEPMGERFAGAESLRRYSLAPISYRAGERGEG